MIGRPARPPQLAINNRQWPIINAPVPDPPQDFGGYRFPLGFRTRLWQMGSIRHHRLIGAPKYQDKPSDTMASTLIQPYLFFGGRCEEALEFYRTALGAQVDMLMH